VFCHPWGALVVVVQEHHDPPHKQWLTGLEVGAVLSLSRFALGCVSCVEVGRLAMTKVGLRGCIDAYLMGIPFHRSPGVPLHPPGPN
jgi:hypothetical protein